MFKGKYILSSIHELKNNISNYLNIDCDLVCENDGDEPDVFKLIIEKSKLGNIQIENIIWKVVGYDEGLIKEILTNESNGIFSFNMQQCSFMFCTIFNVNQAIFDTEVMFSCAEEYVYLFYVNTNKLYLNLHNYKCSCGADFHIQNNTGDNGVLNCPYCGIKRDDMGDDVFDGEFNYVVLESN